MSYDPSRPFFARSSIMAAHPDGSDCYVEAEREPTRFVVTLRHGRDQHMSGEAAREVLASELVDGDDVRAALDRFIDEVHAYEFGDARR